jgi:hypothetical protein
VRLIRNLWRKWRNLDKLEALTDVHHGLMRVYDAYRTAAEKKYAKLEFNYLMSDWKKAELIDKDKFLDILVRVQNDVTVLEKWKFGLIPVSGLLEPLEVDKIIGTTWLFKPFDCRATMMYVALAVMDDAGYVYKCMYPHSLNCFSGDILKLKYNYTYGEPLTRSCND